MNTLQILSGIFILALIAVNVEMKRPKEGNIKIVLNISRTVLTIIGIFIIPYATGLFVLWTNQYTMFTIGGSNCKTFGCIYGIGFITLLYSVILGILILTLYWTVDTFTGNDEK